MQILDLNASFGRTPHGGRSQPLAALLSEAGRYRVPQVAACSLRGVHYDHVGGNDETLAVAAEHPGIIPVGTIDPKQVDGDDEAARCLAAGIRLFRFYPEIQGWEVESQVFRRIVRHLGEAGAVVSAVAGGWGTIGRLAAATADLGAPVVALGAHYFQLGDCVEAMGQFPHLYAETNRLGTHGALAHLVRRVGADRVLFGSGMPEKPLASALNAVWLADLSDDDRAAIFGGNARRLLAPAGDASASPTPPRHPPSPGRAVSPGDPSTPLVPREFTLSEAERAQDDRGVASGLPRSLGRERGAGGQGHPAAGEGHPPPAGAGPAAQTGAAPPRLPERIFDVHGHLGRFKLTLPELSAAETVARLARYRIERLVVSSVLALSYDIVEGNTQVMRAVSAHPELLGYAVLDPHDVAGAAAELARCFRQERMVGVKLHPRLSGRPTGSAEFRALFDIIAPYERPVLIHNDGPDYAAAILAIARAHPRLPIVIAHAGPSRPDPAAFDAAAQAENLYLELATTFPWRGAVRAAIARAGAGRLLFGSDMPLIDPGYVLGHYQDADLTPAEERAVMWENAVRLFPA